VVGVATLEFGGIYAPLRIDLWVPFGYWAGNAADFAAVLQVHQGWIRP
jgi:hypothetical protein